LTDLQFEKLSVTFRRTDDGDGGSLRNVGEFFRGLPTRRLVILGEPGSGKTVLALELLVSLAAHCQENRVGAVPVRLALSGWEAKTPLIDWLATWITDTYRLPPATARALVDTHRILPILDGLDEMDTAVACSALARLNTYDQGAALGPLVLTCRAAEYKALCETEGDVAEATTILVQPLHADEIRQFLDQRIRTQDSRSDGNLPFLHSVGPTAVHRSPRTASCPPTSSRRKSDARYLRSRSPTLSGRSSRR
jgi:predicted NACHT family NTPase